MPRHSKLTRSRSIQHAYSVISSPVFDFLVPAVQQRATHESARIQCYSTNLPFATNGYHASNESLFFSAIAHASACKAHRISTRSRKTTRTPARRSLATTFSTSATSAVATNEGLAQRRIEGYDQNTAVRVDSETGKTWKDNVSSRGNAIRTSSRHSSHSKMLQWLEKGHESSQITVNSWFPSTFFSNTYEQQFAQSSKLPPDFFGDVNALRMMMKDNTFETQNTRLEHTEYGSSARALGQTPNSGNARALAEQVELLKGIRELEEKLALAKHQLHKANEHTNQSTAAEGSMTADETRPQVVLSKEDYMNLVDLYYYSYNSRFSPESTDLSPTPAFLDDHSFKLSRDFSGPDLAPLNEDENYEPPLRHIHETLKSHKLQEIRIMQVFVDLLLDDHSSNRALYEAYKGLPQPGVAYLPKGVIRLFLQRMSTPWTHSEKSMIRYLALIDDMQKENIPITSTEWNSAVYLAGRSFARVTDTDVASSFKIWQQMEREAGVKSSHVTFNILFDIAVRAGKFALAQTILMEMSNRNLRLNRLGRVSLIYYHGLRGDGDGVRKTYRDFVEAGEIVDTLVLNCVIASLLNAKEPTAAEQVYERMKSMYTRLQKGFRDDGTETYYMRYPPPGESTIGREMASNHLGRVLLLASNLQKTLPDKHDELQASMPLVPDFTTFRSMIVYHATKSGDLDRLSVLLQEMVDVFNMPLKPLVFQLLFKGFALHGPTGGPDGAWSVKRLDLCWKAFRSAVQDGQSTNTVSCDSREAKSEPVLPTITQVNAIPIRDPIPPFSSPLYNPPPRRRLSSWNEFVLNLAMFPRERLRRIERFHAQMFDDENATKPHESKRPHTFVSPFFQSTVYQAPEPKLDHEEGEYILPNPTDTTILQSDLRHQHDMSDQAQHEYNASSADDQSLHNEENHAEMQDSGRLATHQVDQRTQNLVSPTRPLICWLLRAYARNTKSRARVEEIWGAVRKMWRPRDAMERESVVRVLRRCLRDCDREGGG